MNASIQQTIDSSLNFDKAETTSVPITLILLLAVFGRLIAAGIPEALALTALSATTGVVTTVSQSLPVNGNTFEVVAVAGMAVDVDYPLSYLCREREERASEVSRASRPARDQSFPDALQIAARTSGQTILVSDLNVMATLSGLFFVVGGPFSGFVHLLGVTAHPTAGWTVQAARQFTWAPTERTGQVRYLIRDRAGQFTGAFDAVFAAEGIDVLRSAPQCPRMNAYAERVVRTIRAECTDRMLVTGQRHLQRVLAEYIEHYNTGRAHRALNLRAPADDPDVVILFPARRTRRRPVLGGLINEYEAVP